MIDRAGDVIFRVRVAPRVQFEYLNPAVELLTGYNLSEWYANPDLALRIVHPTDRRKLQDAIRLRRVPAHPVSVRWLTRDGAIVRTEIIAQAARSRQGALVAVEGIARDLTKAGTEHSGSPSGYEFLPMAFDQAPAGLVHMALDGRLLHVNRRMCDITGFSADELLGRRFAEITHPEDVERQSALLRQLKAKDAGAGSLEARCVCRDGSVARVKVTASRLRGGAECLAVVDVVSSAHADEEEQRRLNYAGIEVDTDRLDVIFDGRPVPLTLKEVLLLRYLIRHRGEMLDRSRLLRDVWGYEHSGRSRTLDVHVCRLRRKLPPLANSLATIGHFGYTLTEALTGQPAGVKNAG